MEISSQSIITVLVACIDKMHSMDGMGMQNVKIFEKHQLLRKW